MSQQHSLSALEQAGLEAEEFERPGLNIRELSGATVLRLHAVRPEEKLHAAMAEVGVELPVRVNESSGQDPSALCLRPAEWLLFSEFLSPARLNDQISGAVPTNTAVLLDLSDGLATFRMTGAAAPWLLAKLSCLDFLQDPQAPQHCARTLLGKTTVVIHYHQPRNGVSPFVHDLIFDRSVAGYLWRLLSASAPHAIEMQERWGA